MASSFSPDPINDQGQTVEGGHRFYLDEDGEINNWFVEYGYHNGPGCKDCGESWCHHCEPNLYNEVCPVSSISPYLPLEEGS